MQIQCRKRKFFLLFPSKLIKNMFIKKLIIISSCNFCNICYNIYKCNKNTHKEVFLPIYRKEIIQ